MNKQRQALRGSDVGRALSLAGAAAVAAAILGSVVWLAHDYEAEGVAWAARQQAAVLAQSPAASGAGGAGPAPGLRPGS